MICVSFRLLFKNHHKIVRQYVTAVSAECVKYVRHYYRKLARSGTRDKRWVKRRRAELSVSNTLFGCSWETGYESEFCFKNRCVDALSRVTGGFQPIYLSIKNSRRGTQQCLGMSRNMSRLRCCSPGKSQLSPLPILNPTISTSILKLSGLYQLMSVYLYLSPATRRRNKVLPWRSTGLTDGPITHRFIYKKLMHREKCFSYFFSKHVSETREASATPTNKFQNKSPATQK